MNQPANPKNAPRPTTGRVPRSMTATYLRAFAFFVLAAAVILFLISRLGQSDDFPGTNSPEAGFSRDMKTHHGQAVQMAFMLLNRGDIEDEQLRYFLIDMIQTQTNQMGQMEAWLNVWGLPIGSDRSPMAWMGHEVTGLMPGMATNEQIATIETLPNREAVLAFMQLMIVHHQAAVDMAQAYLDRGDNAVVSRLANAMILTQEGEISLMNGFIETYEGTPASPDVPSAIATPVASPEHPSH